MKVCAVCQRCFEDEVLSCSEENHDQLIEKRAGGCEPFANYRLDFLHDADAAGETYRAVNTILNKTYLIKIIAPEMFDETARREFLREAQTLSGLIHPNVARTFESGALPDGSLYVVSEFFEAQDLRECLENVGKPSETTALMIARQAAEGLEAMHAAGVFHRKVRPENIILTTDAENRFTVKLQNADFGSIHQKQANKIAERNLDSFRYYSPEQCAAQEAGAQADVYALGIVLYEMLSGNVPFDAPYADALIAKQINEHAPEVKINSFDIRMLLTHLLSDALQKTTLLRLKTANAFARQLRHIEQLATHSSTPPPAVAKYAAMNKPVVVFTPPAKIEKAETPPVVEKTVEISLMPETPVEIPVETEPTAVAAIPAEIHLPVEMQSPAIFEIPAEIEPETVVEIQAENNRRKAAEVFAAEEIETVAEADIAPAAEETAEPVYIEETIEEETIEPVFIDLTTNKLPPIDSFIENPAPASDYQTRELKMPGEAVEDSEIHITNKPVLIEWQQPDDVPTTTQTLDARKKETADAEFAEAPVFIDEEKYPVDAKEADYASENRQTKHYDDSASPVFSYYDSGRSWSLPGKRKLVTGAAVVGLLLIAIFGTFLNRRIQSARSNEQTAVKSPAGDKTLPKSAEPEKVPAAKPENPGASNPVTPAENSEPAGLPNYQPPETTEKTVVPTAQVRAKKRAVKESAEKPKVQPQPQSDKVEVFDKKGNMRSKPADKSPAKSDIFTRPRIVKNQ